MGRERKIQSSSILALHYLLSQPLVLTAWGASLEMAWIEPAWVVHWLKRRRRRKQRKNVWFLSDNRFGPTPMMPASRRGKLCGRWCVQVGGAGTRLGGERVLG